jgi:hypothetical protein
MPVDSMQKQESGTSGRKLPAVCKARSSILRRVLRDFKTNGCLGSRQGRCAAR